MPGLAYLAELSLACKKVHLNQIRKYDGSSYLSIVNQRMMYV